MGTLTLKFSVPDILLGSDDDRNYNTLGRYGSVAAVPRSRQAREFLLLFTTPFLHFGSSYLSNKANRCESVQHGTIACFFTALLLVVVAYFANHSYYVLIWESILNFVEYWLLAAQLALGLVSCCAFSDIKSQLSTVVLALTPSLILMGISFMLTFT